jgi:hypothetical protein
VTFLRELERDALDGRALASKLASALDDCLFALVAQQIPPVRAEPRSERWLADEFAPGLLPGERAADALSNHPALQLGDAVELLAEEDRDVVHPVRHAIGRDHPRSVERCRRLDGDGLADVARESVSLGDDEQSRSVVG